MNNQVVRHASQKNECLDRNKISRQTIFVDWGVFDGSGKPNSALGKRFRQKRVTRTGQRKSIANGDTVFETGPLTADHHKADSLVESDFATLCFS